MKPDLIIPWPSNCDYPAWRAFLWNERHRFEKVIVSFTPHVGPDYRVFVRSRLRDMDCIVLDTEPNGSRDWRDAATNAALDVSTAEWVWFTEQDFIIEDGIFWIIVNGMAEQGADAVVLKEDSRWHPCCLFVKREYVEKTRRYFGPEPLDHFSSFGSELEETGMVLARLDLINPDCYSHMAGTSRNHQLIDAENFREVRLPEEMAAYLRTNLDAGDCHPQWESQAQKFISWYVVQCD